MGWTDNLVNNTVHFRAELLQLLHYQTHHCIIFTVSQYNKKIIYCLVWFVHTVKQIVFSGSYYIWFFGSEDFFLPHYFEVTIDETKEMK